MHRWLPHEMTMSWQYVWDDVVVYDSLVGLIRCEIRSVCHSCNRISREDDIKGQKVKSVTEGKRRRIKTLVKNTWSDTSKTWDPKDDSCRKRDDCSEVSFRTDAEDKKQNLSEETRKREQIPIDKCVFRLRWEKEIKVLKRQPPWTCAFSRVHGFSISGPTYQDQPRKEGECDSILTEGCLCRRLYDRGNRNQTQSPRKESKNACFKHVPLS